MTRAVLIRVMAVATYNEKKKEINDNKSKKKNNVKTIFSRLRRRKFGYCICVHCLSTCLSVTVSKKKKEIVGLVQL